MNPKNRLFFLSLITVLTLLVNLAFPINALADDETPPPAPTEESAQPPTEPVVATEVPTSLPTEESTQEPAPVDDTTVAEALEQLPDNTDLVVINEEGEVLPLASQEAAEIINEGDPQWCTAGKTPLDDPTGSLGYCTAPFARFLYVNAGNPGLIQTLINDAGSRYSGTGTIFISQNNIAAFDQNKNIVLNGNLLSALSSSGLTVQGGWDFTGQTQTSNQSVFKNSTLQIVNWDGNVTINEIKFALTTVSGDGLSASLIDGDVIVNNVTVTDAASGNGLLIDNAHNITVNDSTFNDNNSNGVQIINADGHITLNNVTANRSDTGNGAYLDNTAGTGNISLSGSNYFNANDDYGIWAVSYGNISTTNPSDYLEANRNVGNSGAYLSNKNGTGYVTLGGTNVFDANGYRGMEIESTGNIILNDVEANRNDSGSGAYLNNTFGSGYVTITGSNVFYQNDASGLETYSNGAITLDNIEANQNGSDGSYLDNCDWDFGLSTCLGSGDITIFGTNFNDNGDNGLEAYSGGNIVLTSVDANRNSSHGAYLDNTYGSGDITLTLVTANFNEDGNGVFAFGSGDVTIDEGYFKGNTKRGAYVQSDNGNINVSLSQFINNEMSGLRAEAYNGSIALDEISSEKNYIHGANLGATGDITITDSSLFNNDESGAHILNLDGKLSIDISNFYDNHKQGFDGQNISGNVDIENSTFHDNKRNGAILGDCGCSTLALDVSIDSSDFNDNGSDGLDIYSSGEINLTDVTANGNHNDGTYLDNTFGTGNISTDSSDFSDNGDNGLEAYSLGGITLTDITAGDSDGDTFGNGYNGLFAFAEGKIALQNVIANLNGSDGAYLNNGCGCTISDITIDSSSFNNNSFNGLEAYSYGDIILKDVYANGNGGNGASLFALGDVTIDPSEFSDNTDTGVYLEIDGNAKICDTTFNNNDIGVDASNIAGALFLGNVSFSGNSTDYTYGGSNLFTDCNPSPSGGGGGGSGGTGVGGTGSFIPVTGGGSTDLNCDLFSSTTLILPNGDKITFRCPITGSAVVSPFAGDALPGALPEGVTFISGFDAIPSPAGSDRALDGLVVVSFVIPESFKSDTLSILYWNGSEWVDLQEATFEDGRFVTNGGSKTVDDHFEAITNFSGNFVLIKK